MDDRIQEHARILVEHCTDVSAEDNVVVNAPPIADDTAVAVAERLGEIGANASIRLISTRAQRAYKRAIDPEDLETNEHSLALTEATDVSISIMGSANTFEQSDVGPETNAAAQRANKPIQEAGMENTWTLTQHPAPGNAQKAEMSTEAYADFVYGAVNKDWDAQREFQANMVQLLAEATEVRVVSGDSTDVRMRIGETTPANDYGEINLPGGEAYTAPEPESVEGDVHFDKPVVVQGRELQDVELTFTDGRVVDHSASKNEAVLESLLDTDAGARYVGELGIGMNRDIDRFTYNMLFDEKMGDTVHLALGRAYEENVPEDAAVERNDSAVHQDMIVDMSEDSRIELDGEVVQRDGTFVFEDDFDA
jgi:aminopeptidase